MFCAADATTKNGAALVGAGMGTTLLTRAFGTWNERLLALSAFPRHAGRLSALSLLVAACRAVPDAVWERHLRSLGNDRSICASRPAFPWIRWFTTAVALAVRPSPPGCCFGVPEGNAWNESYTNRGLSQARNVYGQDDKKPAVRGPLDEGRLRYGQNCHQRLEPRSASFAARA